jgi:hypothetical protein
MLILVRIWAVGKSLCIGAQNLNLGSARDPIQTLNDPLGDQRRHHDLPSPLIISICFRFSFVAETGHHERGNQILE